MCSVKWRINVMGDWQFRVKFRMNSSNMVVQFVLIPPQQSGGATNAIYQIGNITSKTLNSGKFMGHLQRNRVDVKGQMQPPIVTLNGNTHEMVFFHLFS